MLLKSFASKPSPILSQPTRTGSISSTTSSLPSKTTTPKAKTSKPIQSTVSKIQTQTKSPPHKVTSGALHPHQLSRATSPTSNGTPVIHLQRKETSDFEMSSSINMMSDMLLTPGGSYRKLVEELAALKKELEQKNNTIEKLMGENESLQRELEEFLSTVDDARKMIDLELKDCNKRIQELESEITELRAENKFYKDQMAKKTTTTSPPKGILKDKHSKVVSYKAETEGNIGKVQKDVENFYFELNEQIIEFMDISKRQYQDFNNIMQHKLQGQKEERLNTGSTDRERSFSQASIKGNEWKALANQIRPASVSMSISPVDISPITIASKASGSDQKKNNVKFLVDHSVDSQSSPTKIPEKKKINRHSVSSIDTEARINTAVFSSNTTLDTKKSPMNVTSPKASSLLRTRLKSDKILQEMKKKLFEGGTSR